VAAVSQADRNVRLCLATHIYVGITADVNPSQTTPAATITRAAPAAAPGTGVATHAASEMTL
jgi:hypothetical protein